MDKGVLFIILGLILAGSLLAFTSASGLVVTNQSFTNITKYPGEVLAYNLTIRNDNSFTMYNITAQTDNKITFPKITSIAGLSSIMVSGTVTANDSFIKNFTVSGEYYTDVGLSNTTYNVDVDFYAGESMCDIVTTVGDKIIFKNLVNDDITLRNADTSNDVTTIALNGTYQMNLDYGSTFRYFFLRRGYPFGSTCTITTMPTQGYVNNPLYNANFTFDVKIIYNPTSIEYIIFEKNYTIDSFESQDGMVSIKNIGNLTAKNVTLSGDWFEFSANNFDLAPLTSKVISYTVVPKILNTSETNKTYTKNMIIDGNFPKVNETFTIFIPYMDIELYRNSSNYQSLLQALEEMCEQNPDMIFCKTEKGIVFAGNNSDSFNMTFSAEQVKGIFETIFVMKDNMDVTNNYNKEKIDSLEQKINSIVNSTSAFDEVKKQESTRTDLLTIALIIISLIFIGGGIVIFIIMKKKEQKFEDVDRF